MARMHSRKKGKSGSSKPLVKKVPDWVEYKPAEIEKMVVKYAKEGQSSAQIGVTLRDTYGIPSVKVMTGKSVMEIITAAKLNKDLPEDLTNLIRRSIALTKHLEENGQDKTAKRGSQLTMSKIKRLIKYYKDSGVLEPDWKFNPKQASFYVE